MKKARPSVVCVSARLLLRLSILLPLLAIVSSLPDGRTYRVFTGEAPSDRKFSLDELRMEMLTKMRNEGVPISDYTLRRAMQRGLDEQSRQGIANADTREQSPITPPQPKIGNGMASLVELAQINRLQKLVDDQEKQRSEWKRELTPREEKYASAWKYQQIQIKERILDRSRGSWTTFTIPPGKSRFAVELSVARSGSTLLLNLFSVIENAFVLPEPHNMFDVNVPLPIHMSKSAKLPSIQSLLDCSFADTEAVRQVFWDYACRNIHWIAKDGGLLRLCRVGRLPTGAIKDKCQTASLNLLKVVRMPLIVETFGQPEAIPTGVKVFNLVRAPWDIFMSQLKAGWFTDTQMPFIGKMPKGADINAYNMERICDQMNLNYAVATSRPSKDWIIVKYEDLVKDFDGQAKALLAFLDIPSNTGILESIAQVKDFKYAEFVGLPDSKVTMTREEAKVLAARDPKCLAIMELFGYSTAPDS